MSLVFKDEPEVFRENVVIWNTLVKEERGSEGKKEEQEKEKETEREKERKAKC